MLCFLNYWCLSEFFCFVKMFFCVKCCVLWNTVFCQMLCEIFIFCEILLFVRCCVLWNVFLRFCVLWKCHFLRNVVVLAKCCCFCEILCFVKFCVSWNVKFCEMFIFFWNLVLFWNAMFCFVKSIFRIVFVKCFVGWNVFVKCCFVLWNTVMLCEIMFCCLKCCFIVWNTVLLCEMLCFQIFFNEMLLLLLCWSWWIIVFPEMSCYLKCDS